MDESDRNAELKEKPDVRIDSEEETSLIPSSIIDHASQRVLIVSMFILIQSWKMYDLLVIKLGTDSEIPPSFNNFSFVLKYAIIDGAFLWVLPILNVPLLTFTPLFTLFITLGLNCITLLMVSSIQLPIISTFITPIWYSVFSNKELTIGGDSVKPEGFIDMNSHFKGKYTIHYVPDSSALFNPFHFEKICLDPAIQMPLQMPIEFNTTTELGLLQLEHITPTSESNIISFSQHELSKLLRKDHSHLLRFSNYIKNDEKISYIEVPITQPGSYKIHKVTDKKGMSIRTFKSEFLIAHCPTAKFDYPQPFNHQSYKCLDNDISSNTYDLPLVQLSGVGPFNVKFNVKLDGKPYTSLNAEVNEGFKIEDKLSLLQEHILKRDILEQQLLKNPNFFSGAKSGGMLSFHLVEIIDAIGVSQKYNPSSVDPEVFYQFKLRQLPQIEMFIDDEPLLVNKSKSVHFRTRNDVKEADFPIELLLTYDNTSNELFNFNFTKVFRNKAELTNGFQFDKQGTITLVSAKNDFCPCKVLGKNKITLELAEPPVVFTKASPIMDKCVGMTGYQFAFDFVGKPPFQLQYKVFENQTNGVLKPVYNKNGMTTSTIKSYNSKYNFEYNPPTEGNYVIRFISLKDFNYQASPILLDEDKNTYLTYFNQRSKVSFFGTKGQLRKDIHSCYGDSVQIPLYFKGEGPYSFEYDFVDVQNGKKLISTVLIQNVSSYTITSPKMVQHGTFELKLRNIKDRQNCDVVFDDHESLFIHSRDDIPEISLNSKSQNIQMVEGDFLDIPLKIKSSVGGKVLDEIEYDIMDIKDSSKLKRKVLKNSHKLRVKEEGIYSLAAFTNGGCKGKVVNEDQKINVTYYPRPSIEVISQNVVKQHLDEKFVHLNPICQGCENHVKLRFNGEAPFVVDYDIKLPSGKIESRSMNIQKNELIISLPTGESGTYEHYFRGVYDSLYTRAKGAKLSPKSHPAISYKINPSPSAVFNKNNILQVCETKLKDIDYSLQVPIVLTGQYPFKINATLTHESSGKLTTLVLEDIYENILNLREVYDFLSLGDHILTVNSIHDGNGCVNNKPSPFDLFIISVTSVPQISKSKPTGHYCVGDHISYNMTGVPPFTVYYQFNGKTQKAELASKFQRLASKPGELSILALQDSSANQCSANFTENLDKYNELKLQIYDLPSVEVQHGDYIVKDIHEGEQSELNFRFEGTPPFSLTYIRTLHNKSQHKKTVVERTRVDDIWEYNYSTMVSLEGTYEAVEVRDAYCTAKRDI